MEVEIGRGKKGRRAYGFDDIAIVPSRRTRDPDDIDITWELGLYQFKLPLLASAMDGVVSPHTAGVIGKLGGLAVLNLEGVFCRYEDAEEQLERIAGFDKDRGHGRDAAHLPGADQAGADRPAHPRDQGAGRGRAPRRSPRSACASTTRSRSRRGSTSSSSRARSSRPSTSPPTRSARRSTSRSSSARCRSRRGGRLRLLPHRPAPHAHRRQGRARGRRPGRRLHHARRARHRRAAGHRDRRRGRGPLAAHARDGRVREGHRRRRHAQRRRHLEGRSPAAPTP